MRNPKKLLLISTLAILLVAGFVGCKPKIKDGVIACNKQESCPSGFFCWKNGFCYSNTQDNLNIAFTTENPSIPDSPISGTQAIGGTITNVIDSGSVGGNIIETIDSGHIDGRDSTIKEIVDSGVHYDSSNQDSGSGNSTVETKHDAGPICSCSTKSQCCDGCLPINQGGICDEDKLICSSDVCRSGVCQHELVDEYCFIDGVCYRDNDINPWNSCQYCDSTYDPMWWRNKVPGSSCDDGKFCTETDVCHEYGYCSGSGNPCESNDICYYCDEDIDDCAYDTDMTWYDPTSDLTWENADPCDSFIWEESKQCCQDLVLCGHSDWRMSSIDELRTLIRDCPNTQTHGECGVTSSCLSNSCDESCQSCSGDCHLASESRQGCGQTWSSSIVTDDPDYRWGVYFSNGALRTYYEVRESYANGCGTFCVRNGR